MELRAVDYQNIWDICDLSVNDEQNSFVATNTNSILEAYTNVIENFVALPFGLYENDVLVGFVMLGYDAMVYEEPHSWQRNNYLLWRFMIDKNYQGKGYGRKAMQVIIDYVKTYPCGKAEYFWTSYEKENVVAKSLYYAFGFKENGEKSGDELVAIRKVIEADY